MQNLLRETTSLISKIDTLSFALEEQRKSRAQRKEEEARLEVVIDRNNRAVVLLTSLIEKLNERGLSELDKLIQGALVQVFPERDYSVYHEITQERGYNSLNFYLAEKRSDGRTQVSNIRNAVGGSIRAIAGLVCLSFYLMKMNAEKFVALDEALSQVDDTAVDGLFALLKSLGEEAGFQFLLVTHDVRFKPYFDAVYEVQQNGTVVKTK